jgi:EmrB/QacA subfamily drug resistance transporter
MGGAVSVALPAVQEFFTTNIAGIQWVVNAYLLTLSGFLLIGGSLGDHYGRKRIFVIGMLVFAAGAILSGFAWSIEALIGFQALQGIGSALMVPQSLAVINACFPEKERGRAIGYWAGISGGIAALGPWLSGWLVETFGWHTVFWITLPVIAVALIVALRSVPENRDVSAGRLDWPGTFFIFIGLFGLIFGLINGPTGGWLSPLALASLVCGTIAIVIFILVELHSTSPLVPLGLFRNSLVSGADAVTLLLYFALNGVTLFTVLNLQQIQGFSPTQAGIGMLPTIIIITFLSAPAGSLADRFGPRVQMIAGPFIVGAGTFLLMLGGTDAAYFRNFFPGLVVIGLGMAFVIAPLTKSALAVDIRFSGSASGVNNAIARTAGLLSVAVLGAVMLAVFTPDLTNILHVSQLSPQQQKAIIDQYDKLGGIIVPDSFSESATLMARDAIRTSFINSYRWAMGVCMTLAFLGSLISFIAIHRNENVKI